MHIPLSRSTIVLYQWTDLHFLIT